MNFEEQFELEHLMFVQRKCRVCNKIKDLTEEFYKTRSDRGNVPSAYSYECKECTKKRVSNTRKTDKPSQYNYPDW